MSEATMIEGVHEAANGGGLDLGWGAFTGIAALISVVSAGATWIATRAGRNAILQQQVRDARADLKEEKDRSAQLLERLHQHMLEDARNFAEIKAVATEGSRLALAAETRLTGAMADLTGQISALRERFDEFLSRLAHKN